MMQYTVVISADLETLAEEVNKKIAEGYIPQGGIAVDTEQLGGTTLKSEWEDDYSANYTTYYHQAMVKK